MANVIPELVEILNGFRFPKGDGAPSREDLNADELKTVLSMSKTPAETVYNAYKLGYLKGASKTTTRD